MAHKAYTHKPRKEIEIDGELVKVRYPDAQTIKIWELQQAGNSLAEICVKTELSEATVVRELRLYRQTANREWPIAELRSELATLAPKAKADIEAGLAKGTGHIGLRLMEGLGVLSPKLDLKVSQDNQPTEEQLIQVCVWAKDIPVLRLAMLKALGAGSGETWTHGGQRAGKTERPDAQGILIDPDPRTPEPSGEKDV